MSHRWIIIALLVIAGCSSNAPGASLSVQPETLIITDQQSSELILVTVTKQQDSDIPVSYVIGLESPNPEMIWFTDGSNTTITSIQTAQFRRKNDRLSETFAIIATKAHGSTSTTWEIPIQLLYNNTVIESKTITIRVE